jgi:hypothetical protein
MGRQQQPAICRSSSMHSFTHSVFAILHLNTNTHKRGVRNVDNGPPYLSPRRACQEMLLISRVCKGNKQGSSSQWDIHPLIIKIKLPEKLKTPPSVPCPSVCNLGFVIYGQWPHDFGCLLNKRPTHAWGPPPTPPPSAPMDGTFNWSLLLWVNPANWTHLTSVVNDNYLCHFFRLMPPGNGVLVKASGLLCHIKALSEYTNTSGC